MDLRQFKGLVRSEFGNDLRRMTPANVREFLDRMQARLDPVTGEKRRYRIDEPAKSYEEILRDFFRQSLERPSDEAFIRLWLLCLELSYSDVTDSVDEQFGKMFGTLVLSSDPDQGK